VIFDNLWILNLEFRVCVTKNAFWKRKFLLKLFWSCKKLEIIDHSVLCILEKKIFIWNYFEVVKSCKLLNIWNIYLVKNHFMKRKIRKWFWKNLNSWCGKTEFGIILKFKILYFNKVEFDVVKIWIRNVKILWKRKNIKSNWKKN